MRVAVIGLGTVSVVHLAAIERLGADLAGVSEGRYRDHRVLLDELRPDVVHVCTPHDQHVPVAIDALERGVHVLLEKPVADTVESAGRLVEAAGEHPDPTVGVCLQNRYNLTSVAARDLLASGELGAVRGASATVMWHRDRAYYAARPWRGQKERSGGGVLINQAIHTLDLLQWLLGDVIRVRGGYQARDGGVEHTAHAVLDHAGGARSVLFATVMNVVDSPVTIEIVTERATLLIRGDLTVTHADGRIEVITERRPGDTGPAYWGASHELLIADFYRSVSESRNGSGGFAVGLPEAMKSLHVIDEIYRSH